MGKNKNCYYYQTIYNNSGLFDKCVDATYIIHLENNGRLNHIHNQLNKFSTSSIVHILYNKGYKKCNKKLSIQDTKCDLFDAFLQIFTHSLEKNYKNILILEDDFHFSEKINNNEIVSDICNFVNNKSTQNEKFLYKLGSLPVIKSFFNNHHFNILNLASHSTIYSHELIKHVLENHDPNFSDHWDKYLSLLIFENVYTYSYKIPICYQLFPMTENRKVWTKSPFQKYMINLIFGWLKLDTQYEPGFTYIYNFSIFFTILVFVLLFWILCKLFTFIRKINISKYNIYKIKSNLFYYKNKYFQIL